MKRSRPLKIKRVPLRRNKFCKGAPIWKDRAVKIMAPTRKGVGPLRLKLGRERITGLVLDWPLPNLIWAGLGFPKCNCYYSGGRHHRGEAITALATCKQMKQIPWTEGRGAGPAHFIRFKQTWFALAPSRESLARPPYIYIYIYRHRIY